MSTSEEKRFLSVDEINWAIIATLEAGSRHSDFRIAILGGVAMQIYGYSKRTTDVDFVVNETLEGRSPFRIDKPLGFGGLAYTLEGGIPVDLIVRDDEYKLLYHEALDRAIEQAGVPVVTSEYLAAIKFIANRDKDIEAVRWLLKDPGKINSIAVGDILRRTCGQFAQEQWTKLSSPYRGAGPVHGE